MDQGTRARPQIETVRYTRVRVAVTDGPDAGLVLERAGTTLIVGTAETAALRLYDETVSREHCEIVLDERGFRLRDLRSTNGVRVNGIRIYDAASSVPLEVALGETILTITPLAEAEPRERVSAGNFGKLVGQAPKMRELFALLARVARTDLTVLIQGETGTGKELVAEELHKASARAEAPFVVFDCSTVAANLIESDLFGHERGAFTGATSARVGALEEAQGGTLFLDEIGELPLEMQQKLLRCLQSGEYRRVGGRKLERADVRVVAATNRNLRTEVEAGRFREDLYYRLEGVLVQVPPLRERSDDIPLLVEHFVAQSDPALGRQPLPAHALDMFRTHRWPGNVRELGNVVRRMQLLPELPFHVQQRDVDPPPPSAARPTAASTAAATELERAARRVSAWNHADPSSERPDWLPLEDARRLIQDAFERDYLVALKQLSKINKTRAAAWGGVTRQAIQKLVRKHDFDWGQDESDSESYSSSSS
ncbi:MAG: sigma 54-interacting transcriptional regulator [Polyangiales bacterium]